MTHPGGGGPWRRYFCPLMTGTGCGLGRRDKGWGGGGGGVGAEKGHPQPEGMQI